MWLPHEYPQAPPIAFVVPTKDMGVRKGREVDPGGRITVAQEWWQDRQLQTFINRMIEVFSRQPPVYAKPPGPTPSRQTSSSTPPPREVLPQYQPTRSGSMDPGSPPVPPRPGMSPPPAPDQAPPVPNRPYPQAMSPPPLAFAQHYSPAQSPVHAQPPVQHSGPPFQPYAQPPYAQPQQYPNQPPFPPQPPPQPSLSVPRPDLLSSPNTEMAALPEDAPPVAPPKPPPPSLIHLHAILQPHLNAALPALKHDLESQRQALLERREDLASGEPAIRDEMARLEAVKKVCDVVVEKMGEVVSKGEERVVDLERRGEVSVDEVVCGISIAHNQ